MFAVLVQPVTCVHESDTSRAHLRLILAVADPVITAVAVLVFEGLAAGV